MLTEVQDILREALSLPAAERAAVAEQLFHSLKPSNLDTEAWAEEAEERLAAYNRGDMAAFTAEEVFAEFGPS